ncbi:MAG: tRNA (guanosine(37)-N1)-methyltransferase TrmD [Firmicutes bacterium]|nr:tRNA (guanosine(37)-N1)-methyltransferase TrmD [Bacillota bacterium]
MRIDVLTLFPEMFYGPLQASIIGRAQAAGLVDIHLWDIRDFATDRHRQVDDYPFGGGAGMVMKPEPVFAAVRHVLDQEPAPVVLMTPQGEPFTHELAKELAEEKRLLLLCGHYEGIDERIRQGLVTRQISIGDYVLTGGELPAMVVIDAIVRFLPGALGEATAVETDSFAKGLLEYPQYTRPRDFEGMHVPDVLLSGDHQKIAQWRRRQSLRRTLQRRPDLLPKVELSKKEREFLASIQAGPNQSEDDSD